MFVQPRHVALIAVVGLAFAAAGCATAPSGALAPGSEVKVDGSIVSVDTAPWTYDGSAVVMLQTATHGQVKVQLPARWNLCKAPQVDVASLTAGKRARAVGTVTEEGALVVCARAEHRLEAVD